MKIKNIKILNNRAYVSIDDMKYAFYYEAIISSNLFIGKDITEDELNKIFALDRYYSLKAYAIKISSKVSFTKEALKNKLLGKCNDSKMVEQVLDSIESLTFSSKEIIENYLLSIEGKYYGKKRIIRDLQGKNVEIDEINNLVFDDEDEFNKAIMFFNYFKRTHASLDNLSFKSLLYTSLINRGFEHEIACKVIESIPEASETEIKNDIRKLFGLYLNKLSGRYYGEQLEKRIFNALLSKGYKYEDIENIKGEFENEMGTRID